MLSYKSVMECYDAADKVNFPGGSSFLFLPMVDLNPGDLTCINSTLQYISSHARRHNVTSIVTFDQPFWLKQVLQQTDISSIVVYLGGLHTLMSFLGAIDHIMAGLGLEELLECIYAGTTVTHMLSGKAISRAVRGHTLVSGAIHTQYANSTGVSCSKH